MTQNAARHSRAFARKFAGALFVAAAASLGIGGACVIIVKPQPPPDPVPVPVPLTCTPNAQQPTVHVYFSVRIDRSTLLLKEAYESFMESTVTGFAGAGIHVRQGLLVRADERPAAPSLLGAWGCDLDHPESLRPSGVITYYAQSEPPPSSPLGCATDGILSLGKDLRNTVTTYPPELVGTNGLSVYGPKPDAAVIVHLDALSRRRGFEDGECASAAGFGERDGAGNTPWLVYADGPMPIDRVFHWFVTSDEGVGRQAFIDGCRALEGFPAGVLDAIEPSSKALYQPLARLIEDQGGHATSLPFCRLFVGTMQTKFIVEEVLDVASALGLSVDEAKILEIIGGGIPTGEDPGGDTLPGRTGG